jgi:hypothetical protein
MQIQEIADRLGKKKYREIKQVFACLVTFLESPLQSPGIPLVLRDVTGDGR